MEAAVIVGDTAYALTTTKVDYNGNWLVAARADFGSSAGVVDFNTLKSVFSSNVTQLTGLLGSSLVFVTYGGQQFFQPSRGYFVEVHNGVLPGSWFVHDTINANTVDLGSGSLTGRSVLATYSVPEPSAISLLVVGMGGVIALRRCRPKAIT